MDDMDIPDESMRHIEALLARHRPEMIQRMFQQALDSRRSSVASSHASSTVSLASFGGSSYRSSTAASFRTSTTGSYHSRMSVASNMSTSTLSTMNSDMAPSIASSTSSISSRSRAPSRRTEPRSYPTSLDPTRPVPSATPTSEMESPLETKPDPGFTPTDETMSIASFPTDRGASQSGESSYMFCTYCAEGKTMKTFKAKSDWKKHEMRMHETGEDWPCIVNGCNRIFDRQKDFLKHHQRYHSGRPLPSLTDIGIQLLPRRVFGCGFDKCKEVSIGWDERCDHVAKHMKNGATFDQWKYSNVIRNLIRQESLHDTWKDIVCCLDERLRESRSQISWCPDNTRVLRQKLQCCDLRPSREEVLITTLSLRSDITLDPVHQQLPMGFVVPSRDSVPNVDKLSREQRMHILIGNANASISRTRLAAVNAALLGACSGMSDFVGNFEPNTPNGFEESPTAVDTTGRRISYMDLDTADNFMDMNQHSAPLPPPPSHPQPPVPVPVPELQVSHAGTPTPMDSDQPQTPAFVDPTKPSNPLDWCYPNYFDAAPSFEESQYYDRPSIGRMFSKPLQRIGSRLGRHGTTSNRPTSQTEQQSPQVVTSNEMNADFAMPNQMHQNMNRQFTPHTPHPLHPQAQQFNHVEHHQQQQQPQQQPQPQHHPHPQQQQQHHHANQQPLHLFTSHN
ncbi:unnamed protein product [Periconia digitata]|uniref:C2H2-type domain-containing protein n=1 Tax=Periconia digitata TaxID=1303443 RepID=A0A9W4XU35_9PLEO|nr:unnamed protein product [Periconia digitata]